MCNAILAATCCNKMALWRWVFNQPSGNHAKLVPAYWWENGDIIHHQLFSSPLANPGSITAEPDKSLIACVHELRVINFDSEAWIKTVLCSEDNPVLKII